MIHKSAKQEDLQIVKVEDDEDEEAIDQIQKIIAPSEDPEATLENPVNLAVEEQKTMPEKVVALRSCRSQ